MEVVESIPSRISVIFEDAWEYSDHYVVCVMLLCVDCERTRVRSLHLKELGVERMFVCQKCGAGRRHIVNPRNVYAQGVGRQWLKQQQKKS